MSELNQQNDYTDREIRLRPLVLFLFATLAVTALTLVFVKYLFDQYGMDAAGKATTAYERQVAMLRPTNAVVEGLGEAAIALEQQRVREEEVLNRYRWVDEAEGIVQIPVAQAMDVMVKKRMFVVRSGDAP